MSGDKKPPIIKKIIKKGHGGHHGGSWKVAYADFVTALMAFFLVMWLLAISSEAGRDALADYFNELTMKDAVFNGGLPQIFTDNGSQGPSILDGGCFRPKTEGDATVDVEGQSEAMKAQMAGLLQATQALLENLDKLPAGVDGGEGGGDTGPGEVMKEQQNFAKEVIQNIQGSLGDAAAGQVAVEKIKGGLRIQIMDKDGRPLFRSGGSALTETGRDMLKVINERLATVPNKISIEGHTDAMPYPNQRMTNWELSAARASATRMQLVANGLADDRLTMVAGYAATQPLPDTDPNDPINRRISIMIWDEEPQPAPSRLITGEEATPPPPSRAAPPPQPQRRLFPGLTALAMGPAALRVRARVRRPPPRRRRHCRVRRYPKHPETALLCRPRPLPGSSWKTF
ncbi:hypothetical protein C4J81_04515 [Deltaproteobacteria bacterium Smac51]|nr:hypothetical protein C4J81_04515 [Deltaproteobacteria bacterium Smac51]